jgi:outer membrane receptor protein involved in Fe transport
LFDGLFLQRNGVDIEPGLFVKVSGNRLPDNPEHTLHLGASYTWDVPFGALTGRWDYYWQSTSYLTIFNRRHTSTGDWDQHNASLVYETLDGRWSVRGWIRNIENDVHILGGYRQQASQEFTVTEPRAYGVSVRYSFGAL